MPGDAVVFYLADDPKPARRAEFLHCAVRADLLLKLQGLRSLPMIGASTARDLVPDMLSSALEDGSLRRLVLVGHGSPEWFLKPGKAGLTSRPVTSARAITVDEYCSRWEPFLAEDAVLSFAACSCSRSPSLLSVASTWGAAGYLSGGEHSLSSRLAQSFLLHGKRVRVRGHHATGHALDQALLREHTWASPTGQSLFKIVLPAAQPTAENRKRWQRIVRGSLAARWLLGDDRVVEGIREAWE